MKKLIALVLAVLMLSAMALSVCAMVGDTPTYSRINRYNPSLLFNTFWRKYQIKDVVIEVEGNGTITLTTANAGVATTGDVVGFTVTVADGWKLADLKVVDALGRNVKISAGKNAGEYTFVMPAVKATIVGTFKEYTAIELGQSGLSVEVEGCFVLDMENAFEELVEEAEAAVEDEEAIAELTDDDYLIAYYINAATNMDFDVYEWAKEEGVTLEDAVLEESEEYELIEIGGYDVAVYTSVDEFEDVEYSTVTYIIDAGEYFEEVVFYLDVEGAAAVAEAMMATLA